MHILITLLTAIAVLIFWMGRAARSARDIADTAREVSNLPRKLRYRKQTNQHGLDLVEDPVEAATVLMLGVARYENFGQISDSHIGAITDQLVSNMQMPRDEAGDIVIQMRSLTQHLKQADSVLFPMIDFLRGKIDRHEVSELSAMLQDIASSESPANDDQIRYIQRFEERMGIGT